MYSFQKYQRAENAQSNNIEQLPLFAAAVIFLEANGWLLDIPDYDDIADDIIAAAEDQSLDDDLAEIFRRNLIETA